MFTEFGIVAKREPSPVDPDYKEIIDLRETMLRWQVMCP
jgi:hypothetical protein